jgi:hypothetical protein
MKDLKLSLAENLSYTRKEEVSKFVISGIFSVLSDTVSQYCDNVLYVQLSLVDLKTKCLIILRSLYFRQRVREENEYFRGF